MSGGVVTNHAPDSANWCIFTPPTLEPSNKARDIVLIFFACAIVDFIWARVKGRSAVEAIACAILGLLGTAWFLYRRDIIGEHKLGSKSSDQQSDGPPHWVP